MNTSINSNGSETGTESSEPIDLTRIMYSSGSVSDKESCFENNIKKEETITKKSRFKGKNKIDIEFITKKSRRQSTFSKRKTGLMKKAYELAELTGAEVLLMIASDTNHVYTYGTTKMKPVFESEQGKLLIEACLNSSVSVKNTDDNPSYPNESSNHDFFPDMTAQNSQSSATQISQLVFSLDSSPYRDSKIALPISISNGNPSSNQSLFSPNMVFPGPKKEVPEFDCSDNIILSGSKCDSTIVVPLKVASISSAILPTNN